MHTIIDNVCHICMVLRENDSFTQSTWRPYRRKDIDMHEQLKMRASKLIIVFRDLSNEEILKEYRLTTLQTRRLRGIK